MTWRRCRRSGIGAAAALVAIVLAGCGAPNDAGDGARWGDFLLYPRGETPPTVDLTIPLPVEEQPDLEGANPVWHPWAQRFASVEDAMTGLPAGTVVPTLSAPPAGFALHGVAALVNPRTSEVLQVETWYTSTGSTPAGAFTGRPDLWVLYRRGDALPILRPQDAAARPIRDGVERRPIERIAIFDRKGIAIAFSYEGSSVPRTFRNAVQWTGPDGTYWTVQGLFSVERLRELAEDVYVEGAFQG